MDELSIREQLVNLMARKSYSQARVAQALGVSISMLSLYLSEKYTGNIKKLEKDIKSFIEKELEREKNPRRDIPFVPTNTARKVMEIARLCHLDSEICVLIGNAGSGKTMAVRQYAVLNPDVIHIEADLGYTAKVLFTEICKKLNLSTEGSIHDMFDAAKEKLSGSGRAIFVDEAEQLPYKALELLRRLNDKAGVGILLVGLPRLLINLRGKKGEFAQLYSRVAMIVSLNLEHAINPKSEKELLEADVKLIVESLIPSANGLSKKFFEHCGQNMRLLAMMLKRAIRLADVNNCPINEDIIERVSTMVIK